jgi:hypothetical protein
MEKAWHPDIQDPEIAFPEYAEVITKYLKHTYAHRRR